MLFVFSAPSGSGKTTIVREILKLHGEFIFSVSATTRTKRENETDGKDYIFISKEDFLQKIESGDFIEYELIYDDNYYGTIKSGVDSCLKQNKQVLFDIDVKGSLAIKKLYGDKAVLIFINPPDKESVRKRLEKRGSETPETLEIRMKRFDFEMEKKEEFDYVVNNDDITKAVYESNKIILKYI